MDTININKLLGREEAVINLKNILINFEKTKTDLVTKRGIYVYGEPGTGKTQFVINILKELNYDVVKYDAGDIRNKSIMETITNNNMSDKNIMSLFYKKVKQIAIVMDEIDGMNSGDKGGINSLIKIIRPKKTKKQKSEEITMNPIICIGNYHIDKKITELMKVCHIIELKAPILTQVSDILKELIPNLDANVKTNILHFIQGDLRKLSTIYNLYKNKENILNNDIIQNIFLMKSYNDDSRKITKKLINENYSIDNHLTIMNETDRTIVGLLWHENIVDVLGKFSKEESIPFYCKILDNMCFADYMDRITFQKQIWQFNEMSSLIKTFKNNKLYHDTFVKKQNYSNCEVRFTKVLTKYSTEYNNTLFIQNLCQELGMDKSDMFSFFLDLKNKNLLSESNIAVIFENYNISKLDINRIYRYLDKYIKVDAPETVDIVIENDDDI